MLHLDGISHLPEKISEFESALDRNESNANSTNSDRARPVRG